MTDKFTEEKDNILTLLKEAYRIMRLTYASEPGAEFTNEARIKVGQVIEQIEEEFKTLGIKL